MATLLSKVATYCFREAFYHRSLIYVVYGYAFVAGMYTFRKKISLTLYFSIFKQTHLMKLRNGDTSACTALHIGINSFH